MESTVFCDRDSVGAGRLWNCAWTEIRLVLLANWSEISFDEQDDE